ncbi:hypothetical protein FQZ97_981120 [compost metagenome]
MDPCLQPGHTGEGADLMAFQYLVNHLHQDRRDQPHGVGDDHRPRGEAIAVGARHVLLEEFHVDEVGLVEGGEIDEIDDIGLGDGAAVGLEFMHRKFRRCGLGHVLYSVAWLVRGVLFRRCYQGTPCRSSA